MHQCARGEGLPFMALHPWPFMAMTRHAVISNEASRAHAHTTLVHADAYASRAHHPARALEPPCVSPFASSGCASPCVWQLVVRCLDRAMVSFPPPVRSLELLAYRDRMPVEVLGKGGGLVPPTDWGSVPATACTRTAWIGRRWTSSWRRLGLLGGLRVVPAAARAETTLVVSYRPAMARYDWWTWTNTRRPSHDA